MASQDRDRRKSAKSTASNESVLQRWKSFVKPFAAQGAYNGRDSCDNGFEGQWHNGVPSVRSRTASRTEQDGLSRVLSQTPVGIPRIHHTRFASSQAMSSSDDFRMTYNTDVDGYGDDNSPSNTNPSHNSGSQTSSSRSQQAEELVNDDLDDEDDTMGLAQQRRSRRYSKSPLSPRSPLSPTFSFNLKERNAEERGTKSRLMRESIRLSALPPMPRSGGSRRSFPAGSGMASMLSSPQKSPALDRNFTFPVSQGIGVGVPRFTESKIVDWNGILDPERPQNRSVPAKLVATVALLGLALAVTFSSSVLTPASLQISQDFNTNAEVIKLAFALTTLGFALGAPFFGALSEKYGRQRPLILGLTVFALFNIPVGITANLPTLLAFRLFAGVFGAAPLIVVPAALADLWSPVGRGVALSLFSAITVIGPVVGAISGSYLAAVDYPSWRWTAWISIGLTVIFGLPSLLAHKESSASVLLQRRAKKLRLTTKEWAFHAAAEESGAGLTAHVIKTALMLVEAPLLLPTIHISFVCGVLNLMFVSYDYAFRTERQWLRGTQDLPLVPVIAGCLIGVFINFMVSMKKYTAVVRKDGSAPPEARIIPWIIGSWILPIGLLVFAWTSKPEITFIPQLMAGIPTGIGISLTLIGGLNYIVDTYVAMPSLAIAATTLVRSALAFAFPLFAPRMYGGLGVAWSNTILAIIAAIMIPLPIITMKLGPRFRAKGKFALKAQNERLRDGGAEMAQTDETLVAPVDASSRKTNAGIGFAVTR